MDNDSRGGGLQVLRDFCATSMKDSMSNSAVLSFLSGVDQVRSSTTWHRNQVDAKLKHLCPDYEPPNQEDTMNVVMNNVITDENSLKSLLAGTIGNDPVSPEAVRPVEVVVEKHNKPIVKAVALGVALISALGGGMVVNEYLNPNPKFGTIPAGTEFSMESEIIEELVEEGSSSSS